MFHQSKSHLIFFSNGATTFNPINNLFLIVIPYSLAITNSQINRALTKRLSNKHPNYFYLKYFEL